MTDPLIIFIAGFVSCSSLIMLYLLYQLIQILREFVMLLMDEMRDE